jgi:hypothetical protein
MGKKMVDTDLKYTKTVLKELKTKMSRMDWLEKYLKESDKKHLPAALKHIETLLNKLEKYDYVKTN